MNVDHWRYPLSSSDPTVVEKSLSGMRTSLQNAKLWGADAVLLVPAVVNPQTSYRDAWTRSQAQVQTPPAGGAAQGRHRDRGSLEQVLAQSARNGPIHWRISQPVDPGLV